MARFVNDNVHYHSLSAPTYSTQEELFRPFPMRQRMMDHRGRSITPRDARSKPSRPRAEGLCEQCVEASVRPGIRIYWRGIYEPGASWEYSSCGRQPAISF